jgi:hypothetical protein
MARKLKDVEALPALESRRLLDLPADGEPGSDDLPAEPGDAP